MDGAKEVAGGLVIAGGNAAILLELVEELLDTPSIMPQYAWKAMDLPGKQAVTTPFLNSTG